MRVAAKDGYIETVPNEKLLGLLGEHIKNPDPNPPAPKYASTVMLVRDSAPKQTIYRIEDDEFPEEFPNNQNLEVFMLRRVKSMAFVPDAVVFPGGRVDDRDANPELPWFGPSPAEWAELMSLSEDNARRVVVAAAREVFEECGVLLAGPSGEELVSDLSDPSWKEDREALERHEIAFADMLISRNLLLRTDLLGLVSNWCTPTFEPRRYDTFFFSALMPEGQQADGNTSEAQIADWVTPSYAMREGDRGSWLVVPPTIYNLTQIASAENAESFVKNRAQVKKFMFEPVEKEDGQIVLRLEL